MSTTHLHLALTHVPVVGIILGLLLLAYAFFATNPQVLRASLAIFVACGLVALAVYFTGEGAEEMIEARPGFSEALIEPHEEAALFALISAVVLGVLSGLGLLVRRREIAKWFSGAVLVVALLTSGIMAWTANLGGQISHPEIRATTTIPLPTGTENTDAAEHEDEE